MLIYSYAKLNLFLEVIRKRPDNYHTIRTFFERIDLHDDIFLSPLRSPKIEFKSSSRLIPNNSSNLAFKAALLLKKSCAVNKGATISIKKRIPVGAGLGGGSSNAAAVLAGLNTLWKLKLTIPKLRALGARIGADVPFFIYDCPFALAAERGDKIKPVHSLRNLKLWHVVAVPTINVSTRFIFKKWDASPSFCLTKPPYDVKILISKLLKTPLSLGEGILFNSLEQVSQSIYPVISSVKRALTTMGATAVLMSGSGPSVFAVVPSRKEAVRVAGCLKKNKRLKIFVSRTQ